MLLGSNNQTALFQHRNNHIEIRWYEQADNTSYYSWKLTKQEIEDILSWWIHSGISLENEKLPIKDYRYKNISISMNTMTTISIRGFDGYGQLKQIGASFPFELIKNIETILCQSNRGE